MFSPFVVLMAAIGIEVGATTALPRTRGFHDLAWSVLVLGGYALSIWLLAVVVRQMSVSVAYAVWSGLGTAAIAGVGALFLGERLDAVKLTALALIIVGVVVLNVHSTSDHSSDHARDRAEPASVAGHDGPAQSSQILVHAGR
jgi:small multidrug resistance pump